jgi:hypothetical protein
MGRGSHGGGRISKEEAAWCVSRYEAGASCGELAKEAGCSRQSMWQRLKIRTTMRPQGRSGADNHFHRGGVKADEQAQSAVTHAVTMGRLVNPGVCEACGDGGTMRDGRTNVQGHHDDYNKPLDVRWLCQHCHHDWHKHNTAVLKR